jgi:hypothetical protein
MTLISLSKIELAIKFEFLWVACGAILDNIWLLLNELRLLQT